MDLVINLFLFYSNKSLLEEKLMRLSIFDVLSDLDDDFLKLIQNLDYTKEIPKIILYNPGGTYDIETYVNEQYFDIHLLEVLKTRLAYKKMDFFINCLISK